MWGNPLVFLPEPHKAVLSPSRLKITIIHVHSLSKSQRATVEEPYVNPEPQGAEP